jgi:hypothetical protein
MWRYFITAEIGIELVATGGGGGRPSGQGDCFSIYVKYISASGKADTAGNICAYTC